MMTVFHLFFAVFSAYAEIFFLKPQIPTYAIYIQPFSDEQFREKGRAAPITQIALMGNYVVLTDGENFQIPIEFWDNANATSYFDAINSKDNPDDSKHGKVRFLDLSHCPQSEEPFWQSDIPSPTQEGYLKYCHQGETYIYIEKCPLLFAAPKVALSSKNILNGFKIFSQGTYPVRIKKKGLESAIAVPMI